MQRHIRNMLLISFSAFFADLGYQAVLAGYPLFLVMGLSAPIYIFGIAEALSYGGGAILSYFGGWLGDKFGKKRIAIIGNALIPILSFTGYAQTVSQAVSFFIGGWWARNLRSPARRAMLVETTTKQERKRAFGVLHALDVGGGVIAVVYASIIIYMGYTFRFLFLVTFVPLIISTVLLIMVKLTYRVKQERVITPTRKQSKGVFNSIVLATALFGFSYYSFGFPIITIARATHVDFFGMFAYALFLSISAFTGYFVGKSKIKELTGLAFFGYLLASIASLGFAFFYNFGVVGLYPFVLLLGCATGFIETFEPSLISKIVPNIKISTGMGKLGMSRSLGLFFGNIMMGVLYTFGYFYSYIYAFFTAFTAFLLVLYAVIKFGQQYL